MFSFLTCIKRNSCFVLVLSLALLASLKTNAQDSDTTNAGILSPAKIKLLKNIDIIANMRGAANVSTNHDGFTNAKINMEQFRLEIKGQVTERLSFRFRDRYTKTGTAESIDNLNRSLDFAMVEYQMNDKKNWYMSIGKMGAGWGGYEFKYNPIEIYQYGELISNSENFLTGIASRVVLNKQHSLTMQVLNSRTRSFKEIYPNDTSFIKTSKAPLGYVLNWQGSFLDGRIQTLCAQSVFTEARNYYVSYTTLGINIQPTARLNIKFDYKLSNEQIDREGVATRFIAGGGAYDKRVARGVKYTNLWTHVSYHINPKLDVFVYGFIDRGDWKKADQYYSYARGTQNLYSAYCYIPGIEYSPLKDIKLKFFASYIGYQYKFSDFAKNALGNRNYEQNRFSFGMICPLYIL